MSAETAIIYGGPGAAGVQRKLETPLPPVRSILDNGGAGCGEGRAGIGSRAVQVRRQVREEPQRAGCNAAAVKGLHQLAFGETLPGMSDRHG